MPRRYPWEPPTTPGPEEAPDSEFKEGVHYVIPPTQLDYYQKKEEWESSYAKVMIPNTNIEGYVKHYADGGFCEFSRQKLSANHTNQLYKKWVEPRLDDMSRVVQEGYWKHDIPFLPAWFMDMLMKTFTEISYDMYETDHSKLRALGMPLAAKLPQLDEETRAGHMVMIDEFWENLVPAADQREYTKDWFKNILQNPTAEGKSGVALIFSGQQGEGKNTFADWFRLQILGEHLTGAESINRAFDKHSTLKKLKVFVQLDEVDSKSCMVQAEEIKKLITDATTVIDEKFLDRRSMQLFANLLMTTNNDETVQLPAHERRMCIIDCNNKMRGNVEYWNRFSAHLRDPRTQAELIQTWVQDDISHRLGAWQAQRPQSKSYTEQQMMQIPEVYGFLSMMCETSLAQEKERAGHTKYQASQLFGVFMSWMEKQCYFLQERRMKWNIKNFAQCIGRITDKCPAAVDKQKNCVSFYTFTWKALKQWLVDNKRWDEYLAGIPLDSQEPQSEPEPPAKKARR